MNGEDFGGAVYRIFDAHGALLYVGSTGDARQRIRQHLGNGPGVPGSDEIRARYSHHRFTFYPTIAEARLAEAAAIRDERPELNRRQGFPGRNAHLMSNGFAGVGVAFAELAQEAGKGLVEIAYALDMSMATFLTKMRGDGFTVNDVFVVADALGMKGHEVAARHEAIEERAA